MNAPARQVLKVLEAAKASEWVVPSVSSVERLFSKAGLEAAWHRIRTAARLDDVRLHDLRHTVGTYAGQSGANAFLGARSPAAQKPSDDGTLCEPRRRSGAHVERPGGRSHLGGHGRHPGGRGGAVENWKARCPVRPQQGEAFSGSPKTVRADQP